MTSQQQRSLKINALKLQRARFMLERAQLRYHLLGDLTGAKALSQIVNSIEGQRQRWLDAIDESYR